MSVDDFGSTAANADRSGRDDIAEGAERLKGEAKTFANKLEQPLDRAREALNTAADMAADALSKAADKAAGAYGTIRERAGDVGETVDPFVQDRPYAALAIAAVAGLVLGAVFFRGGPKVIYVRPPHA